MAWEYANAFLAKLDYNLAFVDDDLPCEYAQDACKATSVFQQQHAVDEQIQITTYSNPRYSSKEKVQAFIRDALEGRIPADRLKSEVEEAFPELHPDHGTFAQINQDQER